jgi:hypothetical protein
MSRTRARALGLAIVCLALGVSAPAALGAPTFHPRVGNALGLVPQVGSHYAEPTEASVLTPVVYHGGQTMTGGVTVHLIFWAPPGYSFQGTGQPVPTNYEGLIEQYYTDVAASSTGTSGATCTPSACSDFTVEPQYGWGTTPGGITSGQNTINFTNTSASFSGTETLPTGADVILDSDPYPAPGTAGACTSPVDTKACVFDSAVQAEVDNLVQHTTGTPRGLQNLWYVFLPPDVDECIVTGVCGDTQFGGYHSLANVGNGVDIYAITPDPIIATGGIPAGTDPQGNPDAEVVIDIADHETNEAMTDPEGVGWMDPNGFEVGDKCEFGPQRGTPLGNAPDGAPFNQVINGHDYWTQEIWSQADSSATSTSGCVQATTNTTNPLPLPQVNLTQFSNTIAGNTETAPASSFSVKVSLIRTDLAGNLITTTGSGTVAAGTGTWSVALPGGHVVGDDRDEIDVVYNNGNPGAGVPLPAHQVILTGNGGNPFTESGWTGWTDLDNGYALTNSDPVTGSPSVTIGPCFQTGTESVGGPVGTVGNETPTDFCSTSADTADAPLTGPVGPGQAETISTNDNRAFQPANASIQNFNGGLVNLTVPLGEADSVSLFANPLGLATGVPFSPTGFPTCSADLGAQAVTCTGLVPGTTYSLTDGGQTASGAADNTGTVSEPMTLHGGDLVALSNGSRTLTTLHVANLQVSINDANPGVVASGRCSPDQWTGGPLSSAPTNTEAGGPGVALSGAACPANGNATGMATSSLAQTDEHSGGQTMITLPDIADTFPLANETLYGGFTALSDSTGAALPISVSIAPASGGAPVFTAANTDTANGVNVPALTPGIYKATWTITDPNGDTRALVTRFIEQPALQGATGAQGAQGTQGPRGPQGPAGPKAKVSCTLRKHNKIKCTVTFPTARDMRGSVAAVITRGGRIVGLGHARLVHGKATLTLRELHARKSGTWQFTLVLSRPRTAATTETMTFRMR